MLIVFPLQIDHHDRLTVFKHLQFIHYQPIISIVYVQVYGASGRASTHSTASWPGMTSSLASSSDRELSRARNLRTLL